MEIKNGNSFFEDTKEEFNGKTYGQVNDRDLYLSFAKGWEMIDKISDYATDEEVETTIHAIARTAENHQIKIPTEIFEIHHMYDFLFFGEHAPKTVFEEIYLAIKNIYIEVMKQLSLCINMEIVGSLITAGIEGCEAKQYLDSFLMEL